MTVADWTPTVAEVAALVRSRTQSRNSGEVGTFNTTTRPTAAQVEDLIATAVGLVEAELTDGVPTPCNAAAKSAATLQAAMLVELSYFQEQLTTDRSPYDKFKDLFDEWIKKAARCVEANGVDTPDESGDGLLPIASYPDDCGGLVGWGTRF